jgi:hypothetical protein
MAMPKKAKKPAKVAKKAKTISAKAAKPAKKPIKAAKPAKKSAKVATTKTVKPEKKSAKLAAKPVKQAALKKKADLKLSKEDKKKTKKEDLHKDSKSKLLVDKTGKKTAATIGKSTPKTLQAKGSAEEETQNDSRVETKTTKDVVVLTDAEGRILCRVKDCDQPAVVENYCRYHYLFFWKKIQNRKKILSEGKLEQYIEELTSRYPLKFLELIRKDLGSEPDFLSAIQELDIDEASTNVDDFEDENFMEEVRGIGSGDTERVDDEY